MRIIQLDLASVYTKKKESGKAAGAIGSTIGVHATCGAVSKN
jgi:alkaline phosphatase